MQAERVEICSARLMSKGVFASWFIPLESDASADDVLASFAQFLLDGSPVQAYPILQDCFTTLLTTKEECMFVFMRRGASEAVGTCQCTHHISIVLNRDVEDARMAGKGRSQRAQERT